MLTHNQYWVVRHLNMYPIRFLKALKSLWPAMQMPNFIIINSISRISILISIIIVIVTIKLPFKTAACQSAQTSDRENRLSDDLSAEYGYQSLCRVQLSIFLQSTVKYGAEYNYQSFCKVQL